MFTPSEDDISEEFDKAVGMVADGENPWPAMSYIQGVQDTLAWITGERDESPLEDA